MVFSDAGGQKLDFARAHHLYEVLANETAARDHEDYCPLAEWLQEHYDLSFVELQAFGTAFQSGTNLFSRDEPINRIDENYFANTRLANRSSLGLGALTASHDWFRKRFARTQQDARRAAFEITPFLARQGLRLTDGRVLPIAPRAMEAWLGSAGAYYRLLDIARAKGDDVRQRFARFNGFLVERHARQLAQHACAPPRSTTGMLWIPGTVVGEQPYQVRGAERRTPDVAIDYGTDLVLIEVTSGRLPLEAVLDARPADVRKAIEKVLVQKVLQLSNRIDDLFGGQASIPGVEVEHVNRIWPLLLTCDGLFQTPTLWAYLRQEAANALRQPRVQSLFVLDMEDAEVLFGLVETGASLVALLESKTSNDYAERELKIWYRDQAQQFARGETPSATGRFELAAQAVRTVLFGPDLPSTILDRS